VFTYFPLFKALTHYGNPAIEEARAARRQWCWPIRPPALPVRSGGRAQVHQLLRHGHRRADQGRRAVRRQAGRGGHAGQGDGGQHAPESYEATGLSKDDAKSKGDAFTGALKTALNDAGYPAKADPARINKPMMVLVLFILAIYVTMVYGRSPRCWWNVPDPHPLHLDVPALPHRQRLVRRLPAGHLASAWWPPPATSTTGCGTRSSSPRSIW
jgi:hypothetical protein